MHTRELSVGSQTLSFETGKLAKQADGAVVVRLGDTSSSSPPATRPTRAKASTSCRSRSTTRNTPTRRAGSRAASSSAKASRPRRKCSRAALIDRPIRPLFPSGWRHETQIIALVLSADTRERLRHARDHRRFGGAGALGDPVPASRSPPSASASSTASSSSIRRSSSASSSQLDLVVAGTADAHRDGRSGREGSDRRRDGRRRSTPAHAAIKRDRRRRSTTSPRQAGKTKQRGRRRRTSRTTSTARSKTRRYVPLAEAMRMHGQARELRDASTRSSRSWSHRCPKENVQRKAERRSRSSRSSRRRCMRDEILERGKRLDGRKFDEIRPITIEVGVLPRTHGSAVFTRGETQALVTATLGTADDPQKIETVDGESWKRFMLHYNFPPFSVGEVEVPARPRPPRDRPRRARRARAAPMLPAEEEFPYTIRIVSDILESNGSSSMASVCGGSLALMDAGVPLEGAGRRRGDGPDHGRGDRQVRRPHRHRRRRRPLRRHGLQGRRHRARASPRCRWTSRSPASRRDHAQGARAGASRAACTSSTRWPETHAGAARTTSRRSRRASSRSRSRWTRSATSSARAARRSAASSSRPA